MQLINGKKPYDWCKLSGWARNQHGLLALVENNEFSGKLLQFNSNGDLVTELEAGGSWLTDIRRGGSIKLEPPDRIELKRPDGSIIKFLIRDGKLADEEGRVIESPKPIEIGKRTLDTQQPSNLSTPQLPQAPNPPPRVQPSAPNNVPEAKPAQREKPTSSMPWSIIIVLIMAATSLLWLLLKRRN
ncbi:hypothetical protein [Prosthecobacter fusiformis]|uniref:hypothetical protein n=1 Tax=Prosthecobacter fusiformis TaxID=48464 RepID=UPI001AAFE137|nr:hypothetical protein [Prosthecobacter fusiformis]